MNYIIRNREYALVLVVVATVLALISVPSVAQTTASQAFDAGKQAGKDATVGIKSGITATQGAAIVPYYGGATPQGTLFGNGQGITSGEGMQRMVSCAINPNTGSAFNQQECNAVNFMARSPTTRPQFQITPNDPLITANQSTIGAVNTAPLSILGNGTIGGTYSACTTTNQTTSAEYRTEVCHGFASVEDNVCPITRQVEVEAKYNYLCEKTPNKLAFNSCNRTLQIACSAPQACVGALGQATGITLGSITPYPSTGYSALSRHDGFSAKYEASYQFPGTAANYLGFRAVMRSYYSSFENGATEVQFNFNIPNVANLTDFYVQQYYSIDGWVALTINGSTPFILNNSNNNYSYSGANLFPYLRTGTNSIRFKSSGSMNVSIQINAFNSCTNPPAVCTETWSNGCSNLESRQ